MRAGGDDGRWLCNTDGCAYSRKIRLARARTTGGRTGQRRRDRVVARLSSCVHLVGRVHHRLAGPAPACNKAHDPPIAQHSERVRPLVIDCVGMVDRIPFSSNPLNLPYELPN